LPSNNKKNAAQRRRIFWSLFNQWFKPT
jgi:hypothetical protein